MKRYDVLTLKLVIGNDLIKSNGTNSNKEKKREGGKKRKIEGHIKFLTFYSKISETLILIFSKLVKHVPFSRLDITNKYYDTNAM